MARRSMVSLASEFETAGVSDETATCDQEIAPVGTAGGLGLECKFGSGSGSPAHRQCYSLAFAVPSEVERKVLNKLWG